MKQCSKRLAEGDSQERAVSRRGKPGRTGEAGIQDGSGAAQPLSDPRGRCGARIVPRGGRLPRARAMGSAAAVQSALGSAASGGVGCINAQASLNGAAAISQGQPVQKNSSVNP